MPDDPTKVQADGGIPLRVEDRKPSPATEELMEEIRRGPAGGKPQKKMEGGKPVSPERRGG